MGHRTKAEKDRTTTAKVAGAVEIPQPSDSWHPIAVAWYESLAESGQSQFYEPSDWASAVLVAEVMTVNLSAGRFSSELFKGVWSAMGELLSTEGSRRRVRLEVERAVDEPKGVTSIVEYKRRLAEG